MTDGEATLASYAYDGLGRRIRKLASGVTYDYYYNDEWQLLEERFNSNSNPRNQYVWHPYDIDALAVRYLDVNLDGDRGGALEGAHHFCQDANFNVTAVVDASGTVLQRYAYTPHGEGKAYGANFTGGGTIGIAQYNTWKAQFGMTGSGSAALAGGAVPEPASWLLLVTGSLLSAAHRRRAIRPFPRRKGPNYFFCATDVQTPTTNGNGRSDPFSCFCRAAARVIMDPVGHRE